MCFAAPLFAMAPPNWTLHRGWFYIKRAECRFAIPIEARANSVPEVTSVRGQNGL